MLDLRSVLATAAFAALVAVGGCRDGGAEGEYFAVSGRLVVFNYRVATATYLITLRPLAPVADGQTAVASFEDPAGGAPIEVRQRIWPKLDKVVLESPPLRCIAAGHAYAATIRIEGADGSVRQTIETTLTSSQDQSILPDRPLVVGPVYTPNPDLAGRPDGKLDVTNEAGCPAR